MTKPIDTIVTTLRNLSYADMMALAASLADTATDKVIDSDTGWAEFLHDWANGYATEQDIADEN